jgi:putative FmdB family regulatory protein
MMPTWTYVCFPCGYRTEIQSSSWKYLPETVWCPRCKTIEMEREISAPAIHFKGDGWTPKGAA